MMGQSRNENLLEDILGASNTFGKPQSRIEAILQNMLGAENEIGEPLSRNEELLIQILEQGVGKWDWKGKNAELIDPNYYSYSKTLDQTDFATWTPSSQTATIVTSEQGKAVSVDMGSYEYLIHWQIDNDLKYSSYPDDLTMIRNVSEIWYFAYKFPSSVAEITTKTFTKNEHNPWVSAMSLAELRNQFGGLSFTSSLGGTLSNGLRPAVNSPMALFSSSTADETTIKFYNPRIIVSCDNNYFKETTAAAVNQQFSTIKIKGELWRTDIGAIRRALMDSLADLFNNSI